MSQDREPFYSSSLGNTYFKNLAPQTNSSSLTQQVRGRGAVHIQGALAHDLKLFQVCAQASEGNQQPSKEEEVH